MLRIFATWFIRLGLIGVVLFGLIRYDKLSIYHLGQPIHNWDQYLIAAIAAGVILALAFAIHTALNQFPLRSVVINFDTGTGGPIETWRPSLAILVSAFIATATVTFSIALYVASLVVPDVVTLWGFWATVACGLALATAWVIPSLITRNHAEI